MKPRYIFIVLTTLFLAVAIYRIFLRPVSLQIYCKKQVNFKLYKFRQSVKKNGADKNLEENDDIKKFIVKIYRECVNPQSLK